MASAEAGFAPNRQRPVQIADIKIRFSIFFLDADVAPALCKVI
jgi:hypothetical protein